MPDNSHIAPPGRARGWRRLLFALYGPADVGTGGAERVAAVQRAPDACSVCGRPQSEHAVERLGTLVRSRCPQV